MRSAIVIVISLIDEALAVHSNNAEYSERLLEARMALVRLRRFC